MSDVSLRYLAAERATPSKEVQTWGGGRNFLSLWARSPLYEFFLESLTTFMEESGPSSLLPPWRCVLLGCNSGVAFYFYFFHAHELQFFNFLIMIRLPPCVQRSHH